MYFDIAAFVVMFVALASFLMRRKTSSPANRVYLSALILVLLTTLLSLAADVCDLTGIAASKTSGVDPAVREAIQVFYYALRSLTAPTYFILIATVSDTTHLLNKNNLVRLALWVPMVAILVLVLTNPFHHVVFAYENGANVRHSGVIAIYSSTAYYSLVGVCWLFRWKTVLSDDEFATLMMLYPLVLLAVVVQYHFASLHVEMFATSVAIMLVSAFVMQPERQYDSLVDAASLQSYRNMCRRAFITKKPLCLVYLEIVNMERLRELVGKDELQNVVRRVAANLARTLEPGDVLLLLA